MKVKELIEKLMKLNGEYDILLDTTWIDDVETERDDEAQTVCITTIS